MTTNAVEAWHHSLKTHAGGKEIMENFSLSGVINHLLTIGKHWEQLALDVEQLWFKTRVAECSDYPELAKFSVPVQSLIVDQLKAAKKVLGSHTHQASNTQLDSASYSAFLFSKVDRRLFILLTQFPSFALGTFESRNHDSSSCHDMADHVWC